MKAIPLPPEILSDEKSEEVVRAFVLSDGRLVIAHAQDAWENDGIWGILLADLARHISDAVIESGRNSPLEQIVETFNSEITEPTSARSGGPIHEQ